MLTVGVDLATEPKNTGMATIEWAAGRAHVLDVRVNVDDTAILQVAGSAAKLGIDCPLGWPDAFVNFLRDFHEGSFATVPPGADQKWRKSLANRETDFEVRRRLAPLNPLSVATDRIGLTAMRAASIQSLLAKAGYPVDRTGSGLLVEVYPAAGLRHWGLNHRQYKGTKNEAALGELVDELPGWLDLGDHQSLCRRSDHAFDAVIAALIARAAALGHTRPPSPDLFEKAAREGWIALPTCALDALAMGDSERP